jgi:hypothetical protein
VWVMMRCELGFVREGRTRETQKRRGATARSANLVIFPSSSYSQSRVRIPLPINTVQEISDTQ